MGMKHILSGLFLAVVIVAAASFSVAEVVPQSQQDMRFTFAPLVKKTSPAVVNIYTKVKVQQRVVSPFFNDPCSTSFSICPALAAACARELKTRSAPA
jgi:S1-C subfamily serine protease